MRCATKHVERATLHLKRPLQEMWSSGPLATYSVLRAPSVVRCRWGHVRWKCAKYGESMPDARHSIQHLPKTAFVTTQILRMCLGARQIDACPQTRKMIWPVMYATGRPPSSEKWTRNFTRAQPPGTGHAPLDVVETGSSRRGVSASRRKMSPDYTLCAQVRITVLRCVGPEYYSRPRLPAP